MVGALGGALMDGLGGAADFPGEAAELGFVGFVGAEVLDWAEVLDELGGSVRHDRDREPNAEQLQGFEQEVVGRGRGDGSPVGFDELEV